MGRFLSQLRWWSLLVLIVCFVVSVENREDGKRTNSSSNVVSKSDRSDSLEQWISRRLKHAEMRLNRKLEDRFRSLNHSVVSTAELRRELAVRDGTLDSHGIELKSLNTVVEEQKRQLKDAMDAVSRLQNKLLRLESTVDRMSLEDGKDNKIKDKQSKHFTKNTWPVDCQEVVSRGSQLYNPGFYFPTIQPRLSPAPYRACCYINESGWTLIQRRLDGSISFYLRWDDYKRGFGNIEGEFWIGNDHIYQLTNQDDYKLRIEMVTWDDHRYWAEYDQFRISDENDKYRLHVAGYHGNAGDSLSSPWNNDHNGQQFSTHDNDNDNRFYDNCAERYGGAWWFNSCFQSHLNGVYYPRGLHSDFFTRNGVLWNSIHQHSALKEVMMMIKPNWSQTNGTDEDLHLQSEGIEKETII